MIKVVLLGSGNVACHLAKALESATDVALIQRYSRNGKNDQYFDPSLPVTHHLDKVEPADVFIIAVKDDAIGHFSEHLRHLDGLVVHTSGSVPLKAIHPALRKGVLYPAQSLSIQQEINFKEIPLVIETESDEDLPLLKTLAESLSGNVFELGSREREKLHISAVFANNFSNFMFLCANTLCREHNIPFDILRPMILETAKKVQYLDPEKAQTGPARRNDQKVIDRHVEQLQGDHKKIYRLLTEAITKTYQSKDHNNGKKL